MATNKAKKRTAGSKSKVKAAKVRSKSKPSLGREGSVGHFFRNAIVNTKKKKEQVLKEARKKFPKVHIPDGYYSWYANDCKKKKLV